MKKVFSLLAFIMLAASLFTLPAAAAESFEYELSVDGIETEHPYSNNADQSWVIECDGAESITLTFHEDSETQIAYDYLYVYKRTGSHIKRYSGDSFGGQSITVDGDYVRLNFTSNSSTTFWGFKVTKATAVLTDPVCDLSVGNISNGSLSVSTSSVNAGESVTLTAVPAPGYKLASIYANGRAVSGTSHTPTCDTVYTAQFIPDKEMVEEGECGTSLRWCVYDDGELYIYGTGDMDYSAAPWDKYKAYIEKVTVLDGVTSIAANAFSNMPALAEVSLSEDIVSIGDNAFSNSSVKEIALGENVLSVGASAFLNCASLEKINIPAALVTFGADVFKGCTSLVSAGPEGGEYNITYGWTDAIPQYAFYSAENLKNVVIAPTVTEIRSCAFAYSGITEAAIPAAVKSIASYAFSNCKSLLSVQMAEGLESIGNYAFDACSALAQIELPSTLGTVGDYAFRASGLKTVIIGSGISTLGDYVFNNCSSLEEISIPASLTVFGCDCFKGCSAKLKKVNYSGTLAQWCSISFESTLAVPTCNGAELYINGELVTSVSDADNISGVSPFVFYGNSGIEDVSLSVDVGNYAFYNIPTLKKVTLKTGCTNLGAYAFGKCQNLAKVILPASIVTVGTAPFDSNVGTLLTTAGPVGSGCSIEYAWTEAIPSNVFYNCRSLVSVTVIKNIKNVGTNAFYGASNIAKVYFEGSVMKWASITFETGNDIVANAEPVCVDSKDDVFFIDLTVVGKGKANLSSTTAIAGDEITITLSDYEEDGYMPGTITVDSVPISGKAFTVTGNHSVVVTFDFYKTVKHWGQDYVASNGNWSSYVVYEDGELYIYGEGDTNSGNSGSWDTYADEITSVRISEDFTTVSGYTFAGLSSVKSIVIPDNITSIGQYAFKNCTALESVTIPESVTEIDDYLFQGCTSLKEVSLPNSITAIPSASFSGCSSLEYIYIPSGVTDIGTYAFQNCTSLKYIILPSSVKSVANYAFRYDEALDTVFYVGTEEQWQSVSVGSTYNSTFINANVRFVSSADDVVRLSAAQCENGKVHLNETMAVKGDVVSLYSVATPGYKLKNFTVDGSAVDVLSITVTDNHVIGAEFEFYKTPVCSWQCGDNVWAALYENGELHIFGAGKMSDYSSPNNLPWYEYRTQIKTVTVDAGVTSIGDRAFVSCSALTAVTIPEGVTSIGDYAFSGCSALTAVTIPESVTSIGVGSFSGCSSLTFVTIPESVTSIGVGSFYGCSSLAGIEFMGNAPTVGITPFPSKKAGEFLIHYHENTTGWTSPLWNEYYTVCVEDMSSEYSALNSSNINSQGILFTLNEEALTAIVGTNSNSYGDYNNSGYYGVGDGNVVIPDVVTKDGKTYRVIGIGSYAFAKNKAVKTVELGANVTSIDSNAFWDCQNFTAFTVSAGSTHYKAVDGILFDWGQYNLYCYPAGKTGESYTVPASVKTIGQSAFSYNKHLKEVTVPETVNAIGSMVFHGCTSIEKLTLPFIGKSLNATSYDAEFAILYEADTSGALVPESLKEVIITGGKLSDNAFEGCRYIERITLPANDTEIPYYAFNYCISLKYLAFADTVDELEQLGEGHLVIPERITFIDYEAFRCCYGFEYIHIPASVESMDSNVFIECKSVKEFIVDEANAYFCSDEWGVLFTEDKSKLLFYPAARVWPYYNVPDEVKEIKNYAFYYCENLVNLYIPEAAETFYYSSIAACPGLTVCTWLDSAAYSWAANNNIPVWAMDNYTLQGIEIYSLPENRVFERGEESFEGLYMVAEIGGRQLQLDEYEIVYDESASGVQAVEVISGEMSASFEIMLYGDGDILVDFGEVGVPTGTGGFAAVYDSDGRMTHIESVTIFDGSAVMVISGANARTMEQAKLFIIENGTLVPVDCVVKEY